MKRPPLSCLLHLCLRAASPSFHGGSSTQPWESARFNYERPKHIAVEQTTPTDDQISFTHRPKIAEASAPDPIDTPAAKPRNLENYNVIHLRFKDALGKVVPALLCRPRGKTGPLPLVIAVHGLGSYKAQVCAQVAPTLTRHGFAVLAADIPCHGERPGEARDIFLSRVDAAHSVYTEEIIDVRQLIDLAEQFPDLDTRNGVTLVGYSLGSWISSVAGPADDRVKAMVLMVGGARDISPVALAVPDVAATDPRNSIPHFAGRPLLLLNGRNDKTVDPDTAKRLFDAAPEPKEQRWYDSGHLLPKQAYEDAAVWVTKHAPAH